MRQYFTKDKDGRFVSGAASPEASQDKYLLWLDTYTAALTGLLMSSGRSAVQLSADQLHELASRVADRLHGKQS